MWSIILSVTFTKAEGKRERERQCIYPSFSFLMFDYPSNLPSCCNNLEIGTLAKTDLSQCLHASLNMQHWRGKILSQFFTKASAQGRAIKSWKMLLCRFPDWWRATQVDICIWYLSPDHSLLNSIKFSGEKNRAPSKSLSLKKSVKHSGKVSNIQYYWAHIYIISTKWKSALGKYSSKAKISMAQWKKIQYTTHRNVPSFQTAIFSSHC